MINACHLHYLYQSYDNKYLYHVSISVLLLSYCVFQLNIMQHHFSISCIFYNHLYNIMYSLVSFHKKYPLVIYNQLMISNCLSICTYIQLVHITLHDHHNESASFLDHPLHITIQFSLLNSLYFQINIGRISANLHPAISFHHLPPQ